MMGKPSGMSMMIALKAARKSKQRGDYGEEKSESKTKGEVVNEWRDKKNAEKTAGDNEDHQQMMETMHEKIEDLKGMLEQMMGKPEVTEDEE